MNEGEDSHHQPLAISVSISSQRAVQHFTLPLRDLLIPIVDMKTKAQGWVR